MESDILNVAEYAVEQPGISGYMCVDKDGLCLAASGHANQSMSGIINQLAELASRIEEPTNKSDGEPKEGPVIRVDLEGYKMLIQSRDSITTALISHHK